MTTGIRGDHLARLQAELQRQSDRIYELERRLRIKPTAPREATPLPDVLASVAITHSANQSIAHNTDTVLSLDTTDYQTIGGMHVGSTVVAVRKGIYAVWASVKWADSTDEGFRSLHLETTGGTVLQDVHHAFPEWINSRTSTQVISWQGKLAEGTALRLSVVQQSGGGSLSVLRGVQFSPYLGMTWLSRY